MEWCERHKPFAEPMLSDRAARFKLRREARAPRPHRQIEQDRARWSKMEQDGARWIKIVPGRALHPTPNTPRSGEDADGGGGGGGEDRCGRR